MFLLKKYLIEQFNILVDKLKRGKKKSIEGEMQTSNCKSLCNRVILFSA